MRKVIEITEVNKDGTHTFYKSGLYFPREWENLGGKDGFLRTMFRDWQNTHRANHSYCYMGPQIGFKEVTDPEKIAFILNKE